MTLHVVLVAVGSAGDVHPFVGLGVALRRRGHRVTVLTSSYFESLVRRTGLEFESLASVDEYRALVQNPDLWSRWRGFSTVARQGILPAMRPVYDAIERVYTPGQSVVATSSLGFGALAAQEKLGVPVVSVHLSPVIFRSEFECPVLPGMYMPPWLPAPLKRWQWRLADLAVVDRELAPGINAFRAELGLAPVRRVLHDWIHSPRRVLGLFPGWFAEAQPDWPSQTVLTGFPLYDERGATQAAPELEQFLAQGEPPVVFTPGSAMVHGREFFAAAVGACRLLKRRGILLTRFPEQLPAKLPPDVRYFDFVPFSEVLPRSAALVHHGGVGSLSQALAAGVPQLVMPMSHDQPDNAARLHRMGLAATVWPKQFQAMTVARELARLIESADVQSRCRAVADRMRGEQPLEASCDEIERAAGMQPDLAGCDARVHE